MPARLLAAEDEGPNRRHRDYPLRLTLECFLWQILQFNTSCRAVLRHVQSLCPLADQDGVAAPNPGPGDTGRPIALRGHLPRIQIRVASAGAIRTAPAGLEDGSAGLRSWLMQNLWSLPDPLPPEELFESLLQTPDLRIERIVSTGQTTPAGNWLEQDQDEWVALLQGEATLSFANAEPRRMVAGDFVLIPARTHHRVDHTSRNPPCIWLAVHGCLKDSGES